MLPETNVKIAESWQGEYELQLTRKGKSAHTIKSYLAACQAFAGWFAQANGQDFSPDLLNNWDLRSWRTWCLETARVSPATWNQRRAALMSLCQWARKGGLIIHDPMEDIPSADQVEQAPRWLTAAEFGRVMRQIELEVNGANTDLRRWRAVRDAAMVAVMAFAGLREAELVSLSCADVVLSERKGQVNVRLGKDEKFRSVPLSQDARRPLGQWLQVRPAGPGPLFVDEHGAPLSTRAVQKRVAALGEAAKVDNLTPHRLRHSCAKRMVDAGRPLTEVQKILGHARLDTTARYTQPGWEDLEEAVESVAQGKMARKGGK